MEKNLFQTFNWFFEPRYWWFRHLLFWFYRYFEVIIGKLGILDDIYYDFPDYIFVGIIPDFIFIYGLLLIVIPHFLLKKKIPAFLFFSFLGILAYSLMTFVIADYLGLNDSEISAITNFVSYDFMDGVQLWLLVCGLRLFFEYLNMQIHVAALQKSNFQSELAFLKSQISPHFLFNTLNNIAVLTETRPEQASETIVNLSNVLRYQLYESEKKEVLLSKEIENLQKYLELEKIRLEVPQVAFLVEGEPNGKVVAPLLFLPFFENAIKHGVLENGSIDLAIQFKIFNNGLEFLMQNKIAKVKPMHTDGGIGLKNVQRRLELLYPNRHNLRIEEQAGLFEVQLNLVFENR